MPKATKPGLQSQGTAEIFQSKAAFHQWGTSGTERGSDVPKAMSQTRARGRTRAPGCLQPDTAGLRAPAVSPGPQRPRGPWGSQGRMKEEAAGLEAGTGLRSRSQATKRGRLTNQGLKADPPPTQRGRSVEHVPRGQPHRDPRSKEGSVLPTSSRLRPAEPLSP